MKKAEKADPDSEDPEEDKPLLPEGFKLDKLKTDIYTLFFTAPVVSESFAFASCVFLFQLFVMILVMNNNIDPDSDKNPLKIPAGVDIEVTIGQAFCMILLPRFAADMLDGVEFLIDGYHLEVLDTCPDANKYKWFLAGFLHFGVGALMICNQFILLMQQTRVIELAVKLTAFGFFSKLDNLAYTIAASGFLGPSLNREIDEASEIEVLRAIDYTWSRRFADTFVAFGLFVGYGVLVGWQLSGKYVCDSVFVQLGDVYNPLVVELTGMFDIENRYHERRAVYSERSRGEFHLAYCGDMQAWTLANGTDPCASNQLVARSGVDEGYSILDTADSWKVADMYDGGFKPFDHYYLSCNECDSKCKDGTCDASGSCVCKKDHYGVNCEFESPCPSLTLDRRTTPFPRQEMGLATVPHEFELLKLDDGTSVSQDRGNVFQIEFRPVYFGIDETGYFSDEEFYVLFFAGRRWVIIEPPGDFENKAELVDYMSDPENFNPLYSDYKPLYASAPMDVGTPSDGLTPATLPWFYVSYPESDSNKTWWHAEESEPTSTTMHCGFCDQEFTTCANYGTCRITDDEGMGECDCLPGYVGARCEKELQCTDAPGSANEDDEYGEYEEYVPTDILGCENNGTCTSSGNCNCLFGFFGSLCQFPVDCNLLGGCLNDGVCNEQTGICTCVNSTFYGHLCQFPDPPEW